jgi:hypothetical protein
MLRLLALLLLLACNTSTQTASNDLGPYRFVAPGDVEPAKDWGEMMAAEYADILEDSTENAEFTHWTDSMKRVAK